MLSCRSHSRRPEETLSVLFLLSIHTDIALAAQYAVGKKNARKTCNRVCRNETRPMWSTGRRESEGRRIKMKGDRGEGRGKRRTIIDAGYAIVDKAHSQPRSVSALDVTRMHVPVAH